MTTLWLTYGARTVVEDCEDAWDDRTGGNVTCSADSSIKIVGAKSAKMLTGAEISATTKMASETISSADYSSFTHLLYWIRCTSARAAGDLEIMLDDTADCASPIESIDCESVPVANQWYRHCVPLATPASDSAIVSVGLKAGATIANATSIYLDALDVTVAKSFTCYGVRGLYDPDEVVLWPGISNKLLDGSESEHIHSYKRIITIDMAPVTTKADRLFLLNWARASEKYIIYICDDIRVVLEDPSQFTNEWMGGVENFRRWTLRCVERSSRTTDPLSWGYTI